MSIAIERVWWHGLGCGFSAASVEPLRACPKCGTDPAVFEDLGYRVGYNETTYSWYSTYEHARRDGRLK